MLFKNVRTLPFLAWFIQWGCKEVLTLHCFKLMFFLFFNSWGSQCVKSWYKCSRSAFEVAEAEGLLSYFVKLGVHKMSNSHCWGNCTVAAIVWIKIVCCLPLHANILSKLMWKFHLPKINLYLVAYSCLLFFYCLLWRKSNLCFLPLS